MTSPEHTAGSGSSPAAWYALLVLTVVTLFALVDRQVLLLLAEPIRAHFRLTDLQVGLLQGTGIALFTLIASFPLGWLSDRFDRRAMLVLCITIWSLAVVGCALAASFEQLFLATAMVGFGEAGLAPISYGLIPLLFHGRSRQAANSIFALASIGGGALALALTGVLIGWAAGLGPHLPAALGSLEPWRLGFLAAALPAPLMIFLVLTIRIPSRQQHPLVGPALPGPAFLPYARRNAGTFLRLYGGVALSGGAFGGVIVWLAIAGSRVFGQSPAQVGAALGTAQIVSAASGFLLSLAAVRWLEPRMAGAFPVRGMWLASLVSMPVCLLLLGVSDARQMFAVYALYGALLTFNSMLYPTALQAVTPVDMRGRAVAVQFMATMAGAAVAPPLIGWVSDLYGGDGRSILHAIATVVVPCLALSAILLRSCERGPLGATLSDAAGLEAASA